VRSSVLLVALLLLTIPACDESAVDASGNIVSEVRDVGSFDGVDASQGVNVRLVVDAGASRSVTVNYDDNVIDDIDVRVDGETLKVRLGREVTLAGGGDRYVAVILPALTKVAVTNGANLSGEGSATALEVDASGGANVDLGGLEADRATVDLSGGANAVLRVTDTVDGNAANGANLLILGDPRQVDVETSGGANVSTG
jgi:hypothetical protein